VLTETAATQKYPAYKLANREKTIEEKNELISGKIDKKKKDLVTRKRRFYKKYDWKVGERHFLGQKKVLKFPG